jgi:cation diffusion facilitator family transporter
MKSGTTRVVVAALGGNAAIALIKFVVAALSMSAAMLAEAVHSLADTTNQVLLLVGLKRSEKPADDAHPFGYGLEQYFWSFVVALMLFFVGAVVSIYEGVEKILEPHPLERTYLVYAILGVSLVIEAFSFSVAYREFKRKKPRGLSHFGALRATKDATVAVVLLEDSAALCGLAIALVGVAITEIADMPVFDGVSSICIGVLLACVAFLLARKTKGLLIGEAASAEDQRRIREALAGIPGVGKVSRVATLQLGASQILVGIEADFDGALSAEEVERLILCMEGAIKRAVPAVRSCFIEPHDAAAKRRSRAGGAP